MKYWLHIQLWWTGWDIWFVKRRLDVLALSILLCGCAGPLPMTRDADRMHVSIVVQWATPEQIATMCKSERSMGCLIGDQLIVTRKPTNWGDEAALLSLGHEVYHALGARHDF